MGLAKAYHSPNYRPIGHSTLQTPWMAQGQGIIGLPASHLMAFMYDNIQIILTGLYGASNFLKWYLYQPLLYPSIYSYCLPTTMPPIQTPKTYLHKILTKLLKIILKKFLKKNLKMFCRLKYISYLCSVEKAKRYLKF